MLYWAISSRVLQPVMNSKRSMLLITGLGAVLFGSFVYCKETTWREQLQQRVKEHGRAMMPVVLNRDASLTNDYLELAAQSYGYRSIVVDLPDNPAFIAVHGPHMEGVDWVLDRLGLLPVVRLKCPIMMDESVVGKLEVVAVSRTIYEELYALIGLVLLMFVAERSLQVVEGKRHLELRVAERTRQLKENETKLQELVHLLDLTPDVIFVREPDGHISYYNKGAAQLFKDRDPQSSLSGLYRRARELDTTNQLSAQGTWSGELESTLGGDKSVTLQVSVTLELADQSHRDRQLIFATDVSRQRALENHLRRGQRTQLVGTMTSGIAHNFNNLLSPIILSVGFLKEGSRSSEQQQRMWDLIDSCARRGADLVKQLMNLSGHEPARRTTIRLGGILDDIEQLLVSTFPKSIRVDFASSQAVFWLTADPSDLHQAILNLCLNARDAMPQGGRLKVSVEWCELDRQRRLAHQVESDVTDWVRIRVEDDGEGISAENLTKIFDPFYSTKRSAEGTGLGLSTVQGIMRRHGGFIEVDSVVDQGTTFSLFLPPGKIDEVSAQPETTPEPSVRGKGTVLLVDDEKMILEAASMLLEELGYEVIQAESGQQALAEYERHRDEIVVVMTDLMMPGMDGGQLIERLRERRPNIPTVVITGLLNQENQARLKALGVDQILAKPYQIREVETALAVAVGAG